MTYQTNTSPWWGRLPSDLVAVVGFVVLANVAFFLPVTDTFVRLLVGLPILFILPGYVLVSTLYPARRGAVGGASRLLTWTDRPLSERALTWPERLAVSFGLSLALLPLVALGVSLVFGGFHLTTDLGVLSGLIVLGAVTATARRFQLPPDERARAPVFGWLSALHASVFDADSSLDALLNVVVVLSVLVALTSITYAVAVPQSGGGYATFSLYTRNESGGLVAGGYPTNLTQGQTQSLVVAVDNHGQQVTDYTVVAELQRVRQVNDTATVVEETPLESLTQTVAANQSWTADYGVRPQMTGRNLRLVFYLYRGDAPKNPSAETAYRTLHLWVNVTAPAG